jgi:hypothetical protein
MPKHADDELEALFAGRTHHREILIDMVDTREGSRFGGQPPASLAAAPPRCPVCGGALQYVLTLAGDTLGEEIARGKAVSLLACREYACLMTSHALTEPSSTVLVTHDDAPRATRSSELDTVTEGRRLALGKLTPDPMRDGWVYTDASKLGGGPGFIQTWGPEEAEKAARYNRRFLFQWGSTSARAASSSVRTSSMEESYTYILGSTPSPGFPNSPTWSVSGRAHSGHAMLDRERLVLRLICRLHDRSMEDNRYEFRPAANGT